MEPGSMPDTGRPNELPFKKKTDSILEVIVEQLGQSFLSERAEAILIRSGETEADHRSYEILVPPKWIRIFVPSHLWSVWKCAERVDE
jgi:hypothetical protein